MCCFARESDTEDTILLATSRWRSHEAGFCPLPCLRHEQQLSPACACCWERSSALLQRIASTSSYVPRVAAGYIRAGHNRLTGVGLGCWLRSNASACLARGCSCSSRAAETACAAIPRHPSELNGPRNHPAATPLLPALRDHPAAWNENARPAAARHTHVATRQAAERQRPHTKKRAPVAARHTTATRRGLPHQRMHSLMERAPVQDKLGRAVGEATNPGTKRLRSPFLSASKQQASCFHGKVG